MPPVEVYAGSFSDGSKMARPPFFYGWIIVASTFVLQFVAMGLSYYAFGVYLKPLTEALETDRFYVALTLSFQSMIVAMLSPLAGRAFARYDVRWLLSLGVLSLMTGFLLLSQVTALWQLYLLYGGLVGIGMVLIGTIPCNMLLANWFARRRGTAMGISQFGITISATVLVPVVTWLLLTYGMQVSFVVCGIGAAVLLLPVIWLTAIRRPEDVGLHPDGRSTPLAPDSFDSTQWTFVRAVGNRDFWLIALTMGPCFMAIASVVLAMPSHATDLGLTPMQASGVVAVTTFMGALAKPTFGILADQFNQRVVVALAILLQASGVSVLLGAADQLTLSIGGFLFGLGYGGMSPLWSVLIAERFGRAAFASAMGAIMPMIMPFNMVGLPLATLIFDTSGTYLPVFYVHLVGYVIALIAVSQLRIGGQPQSSTSPGAGTKTGADKAEQHTPAG